MMLSISAKFASFSGLLLNKMYILSTDTYSITILFGFALNFAILFSGYKLIFKYLNRVINANKIRSIIAQLVTFFEVVFISTFLLFMIMQLKPSKLYIYPYMQKTVSYPYIKGFYVRFLNDKFIKMIFDNGSTMSTQEIIFKSAQNAISH